MTEKLYEVTVDAAGRRTMALRDVSRDEAETYAKKVNAGKVKGESDALIAPARKKASR